MHHRTGIVHGLLFAGLLAGLAAVWPAAQPTAARPLSWDRAVFSVYTAEGWRIAAADPVDPAAYQLLVPAGSVVEPSDRQPTLAPDRSQVAFTSNRAGGWQIFVLDLPTGALRQLTFEVDPSEDPAWAPDGSAVYFSRPGENSLRAIYRYDLATDEITGPLPKAATLWTGYFRPSAAPDGSAIAYVRKGSPYAIELMDPDGAHPHTLVSSAQALDRPIWSPDGKQIAFAQQDEHDRLVVNVVSVESGQVRRLYTPPALAQDAVPTAWTPDGAHIVVSQGAFIFGDPYADTAPRTFLVHQATGAAVELAPGTPLLDLDWVHALGPDLQVTLEAGPDVVYPGNSITVVARVRNAGDTAIGGVLSLATPPGLTLRESCPEPVESAAGLQVHFPLLAPNAEMTWTLVFETPDDWQPAPLRFTAAASSEPPDANPANNAVSRTLVGKAIPPDFWLFAPLLRQGPG